MSRTESPAIEVEVLEIDGSTPETTASRSPSAEPPPSSASWTQWQGRIRRLDRRWWPLWLLLGLVAFVLLVTLGLVVGLILLVFKLLGSIVRSFGELARGG